MKYTVGLLAALTAGVLLIGCGGETAEPVCGNGNVEAGEACDDGNLNENDACLSTCVAATCGDGKIQRGVETCDDGNTDDADRCTNACQLAACGDGIVADGEACDDGNQDGTDGCTTECKTAVCGDGFVQAGVEACDDGNADPFDTCRPDCVPATCGDKIVQVGEECDDGNQVDTDTCRNNCLAVSCGDGIVSTGEECDDGNDVDTDGCTSACTVAACGDGFIQAGEACDDGAANGWTADACRPDTCALPTCGDGVRDSSEGCDDGNTDETDACISCVSATCGDGIVQTGWEECDAGEGNSNTAQDACRENCRFAWCGDGVKDTDEACDDGNRVDTDECRRTCEVSQCGDGVVQAGVETCDDGNEVDTDACTNACAPARCGDLIVQEGVEQCDDGNLDNNDGCLDTCMIARCGDGVISTPAEECDDSNDVSGDGCSSRCKIEGDNCGVPFILKWDAATNRATATGDTSAFLGDYTPGCSPGHENSDVVYELTSPVKAKWTIQMTSTFDGIVALQTTCGEMGTNLACDDGPGAGGTEVITGELDANQTAYVLVDGFDKTGVVNSGTYSIVASAQPIMAAGEACDPAGEATLCDAGLVCPTAGAAVCTAPVCGDGVVTRSLNEECDDGNTSTGDGCDAQCVTEPTPIAAVGGDIVFTGGLSADDRMWRRPGYTASGACGNYPSTGTNYVYDLHRIVNNGTVRRTISLTAAVQTSSGGYAYIVEPGFDPLAPLPWCKQATWISSSSTPKTLPSYPIEPGQVLYVMFSAVSNTSSTYQPGYTLTVHTDAVCGDGVLMAPEACDDANSLIGDGCSSTCTVEQGWTCTTPGQACFSNVCGDGQIGAGEQCDGGNALPGDGCNSACQVEGSNCASPWDLNALSYEAATGNWVWTGDTRLFDSDSSISCSTSSTRRDGLGKFTAPRTADYQFLMTNPKGSMYMAVLDGTCTPGSPELECTTSSPKEFALPLEAGQTVYIAVDGYNTTSTTSPNEGEFTVRVMEVVCGDGIKHLTEVCDDGNTVEGDSCTNACQLNGNSCEVPWNLRAMDTDSIPGSITVNADIKAFTNEYRASCEGTANGDTSNYRDAVYVLHGNGSSYEYWTFTLSTTTTSAFVLDATTDCDARNTALACVTQVKKATPQSIGFYLGATDTVYLHVDTVNPYDFSTYTYQLVGKAVPVVPNGFVCDSAYTTGACAEGFMCGGNNTCTATVCGNSMTEPGEECDDGNSVDNDECTNECVRHGDSCEAPYDLNALDSNAAGDVWEHVGSLAAMTPTYSGSCSSSFSKPDVTYKFTAPATGRYRLGETGALDMVVYAWNSCPTSSPTELACNDGADAVELDLTAGQTVYFNIDLWSSSSATPGPYTAQVTRLP